MLEYAKDHFGKDTLWTFQQDGATSTLLTSPKIGVETIFQIFGPKKCGLHISPDLNPMDFFGVVYP